VIKGYGLLVGLAIKGAIHDRLIVVQPVHSKPSEGPLFVRVTTPSIDMKTYGWNACFRFRALVAPVDIQAHTLKRPGGSKQPVIQGRDLLGFPPRKKQAVDRFAVSVRSGVVTPPGGSDHRRDARPLPPGQKRLQKT